MDEVEVTSTLSQLLLENMLPKHVVGIILNPKRNKDVFFANFIYKQLNIIVNSSLAMKFQRLFLLDINEIRSLKVYLRLKNFPKNLLFFSALGFIYIMHVRKFSF